MGRHEPYRVFPYARTHARMCTLGWGRRFGREPLLEQLAARYTVPATTESEEELKARGLEARAAAAGTARALRLRSGRLQPIRLRQLAV